MLENECNHCSKRSKNEIENWDVHQLLTLSSLIEEEATGFTDRQKISSVFIIV